MAKKVLALALRPRSFKTMYGQAKVTSAIQAQFKSGREPRTWLFAGETGSGKTTIARILARSLQCPHDIEVGGYCKQCGEYPITTEINAATLNTVEAIKELAQGSEYGPQPPFKKRVYILDEAQRVTKQAQGVLLKYTEDTPATTVWIICTTEPEAIIRPLRGRCMIYYMQPLKGKEADRFVKDAAAAANIERDLSPFVDVIHLKGVTSPRIILYALEKYSSGLDPEECLSAVECQVDTHRICLNLVKGDWGPIRAELEKAVPDDARTIRGAVLGYLKSVILNRNPSVELSSVAYTLKAVGELGYQDDGALLALLAGALWRCVKKF